jgi:hypothetical protein
MAGTFVLDVDSKQDNTPIWENGTNGWDLTFA